MNRRGKYRASTFGHPRRLPIHPVVHLAAQYFSADDVADPLFLIGIRDQSAWLGFFEHGGFECGRGHTGFSG